MTEKEILWNSIPEIHKAECPRCGEEDLKRNMTSIYTRNPCETSPHILCYLCKTCMKAVLHEMKLPDDAT